jgi:hypothetical protein
MTGKKAGKVIECSSLDELKISKLCHWLIHVHV